MDARRRKVLWLVKGLGPGGAERLLVEAAAVHDRDRFSFEADYLLPWKDALVPELEARDVPTRCLQVRDERDPRWAVRLRRRLVREPVDVLHVHNPYPAIFARLVVRSLPRRIRPKLVYTVHNTWTSFRWPTRVLNGVTYALDDADIAVSERVADTIWRPLRARTEVVVHGIVLAAVRAQAARRADVRAELGIAEDELVAGTVANFRAQKDYPNLLAAARLLADRGVPLRFVAVGQGPLEEEMRALHRELGLGERVLLLGQRSDAVAVMGACDLFTLASDNEGLPVALMEAMALGLPIVATAVGGVPEVVSTGREGVLVPPKDPVALAAALETMAADPQERARAGCAAKAASAQFDIAETVRRVEAVYRSVLAP
jgi:glycosyltransferase involved in cell wall biosynthesis